MCKVIIINNSISIETISEFIQFFGFEPIAFTDKCNPYEEDWLDNIDIDSSLKSMKLPYSTDGVNYYVNLDKLNNLNLDKLNNFNF